ncbi:MAG: mucoidy inhibitor MuiA family protein [Myxococcaceae bacterium]
MLPIAKVTCLEDRAQIERRGTLSLPVGTQRLRIEGLSPLAVDRSLKVELSGATLLDARVVRQWKKKPKGNLPEDASALRRRVHELQRAAEALEGEEARLSAQVEVVRAARSDLQRAVGEATGAARVDAGAWRAQLTAVRTQEAKATEALRQLARAGRQNQEKLEQASSALALGEEEIPELEAALELVVEGLGGQATVKTTYLVPSAVWRPSYRATLSKNAEGARVHLAVEAVVWQRTGEAWNDVELVFSTARPTLGAAPPTLVDDWLSLRDKSDQEKRTVEVSIREQVIQTTGEGGARPSAEMPGLDDGGEVRVLGAPQRASVPSDGQPHRVALSAFEAPAQDELLCAPELSALVSRVARFDNLGKQPLLAGPVDLVRDSGFIGRSQLKFAAVGERVKLSFGSEDSLRVVRDVQEKQDESRLTGRRTTRREVKLFVSNTSGTAQSVALEERLLVSEVKEVEVKVLPKETRPSPASVSKEGIARFELAVPPHGQQRVDFVYEISAASKVAGI